MASRKPPYGQNPTPEQIKAVLNFILASKREALLAMSRRDTDPPPATGAEGRRK